MCMQTAASPRDRSATRIDLTDLLTTYRPSTSTLGEPEQHAPLSPAQPDAAGTCCADYDVDRPHWHADENVVTFDVGQLHELVDTLQKLLDALNPFIDMGTAAPKTCALL